MDPGKNNILKSGLYAMVVHFEWKKKYRYVTVTDSGVLKPKLTPVTPNDPELTPLPLKSLKRYLAYTYHA